MLERLKTWYNGVRAPDPAPFDYDDILPLDAEDLAEQGILAAYREVLPHLARYCAHPIEIVEELDNDGGGYAVVAAGVRHQIHAEDHGHDGESWARATVALFRIVNANLADSTHKFYALNGGNDLSGIFLTDEQFRLARRVYKRPSDWPWMPDDRLSGHGHPVPE
ncbi:hypothetical protein IP92_05205 [Pseudoduganella flava]|uniref:Uncharacterized protein n=1 Tax=Pseudoduganella flava TaxID=871742 RepID=A0A562PEF7_9BURK|nr:hypothetical protein [Pseudoduganella flava]QGZ38812.1 hypothetical protein GO485_06950 [Pseudoduganella flava]TWI42872.1 hypothetical protein IP92_05205 [Pseudoduganella flava]